MATNTTPSLPSVVSQDFDPPQLTQGGKAQRLGKKKRMMRSPEQHPYHTDAQERTDANPKELLQVLDEPTEAELLQVLKEIAREEKEIAREEKELRHKKLQEEARLEVQNLNTKEWKANETSRGDRASFTRTANTFGCERRYILLMKGKKKGNQTLPECPPLDYKPSSPQEVKCIESLLKEDYGSFMGEWTP